MMFRARHLAGCLLMAAVPSSALAKPDPDTMIAMARAHATLEWECKPAHIGPNSPCGKASKHQPGKVVGTAYAWGGFDDVNAFQTKLSQGRTAGCHDSNTKDGITECMPGDCYAGIDCSGLVSRAWGLGTKAGTATLEKHANVVEQGFAGLAPGDAVNKPSKHVVLFVGLETDGRPRIIEARGSRRRVIERVAQWSELSGYTVLRRAE